MEVQNNEEYDYLQRILFGASKTIAETMGSGKSYENVKKVISISVVYFEVGQGLDYIYHGMTQFRGIHLNDELLLSEEQQIMFQKLKPQDLYPEYYLIKAGDFDVVNAFTIILCEDYITNFGATFDSHIYVSAKDFHRK